MLEEKLAKNKELLKSLETKRANLEEQINNLQKKIRNQEFTLQNQKSVSAKRENQL